MPTSTVIIIGSRPSERVMSVITSNDINSDNNNGRTIHRDSDYTRFLLTGTETRLVVVAPRPVRVIRLYRRCAERGVY